MKNYVFNLFNYTRRQSDEIQIGNTPMGGDNSVRIQSMTNTNTLDTDGSVAQCIRIIEAGGEYVRLTAQGVREAENLKNIHDLLRSKGYNTPLVADIHFNPKAAEVAALYVEKVRINPGNFVFTDALPDGTDEFEKVRTKVVSLINICKEHHTALRIGVNHGSLSERIMKKYGDTPQGMVESAMEFLRVCKAEDFNHVVISMKASNTLVMVQSVRLLVAAMNAEGMNYPLHLGVTEAGDGEDGRVKSAVGIGALLSDGIGDTIRVSLSEDPELEIPVANKLVNYINGRAGHDTIEANLYDGFDPYIYKRRETYGVNNVGGGNVPIVVASSMNPDVLVPDYVLGGNVLSDVGDLKNNYPVFSVDDVKSLQADRAKLKFLKLSYPELTSDILKLLENNRDIVILLSSHHVNPVGEMRAFFHTLLSRGITTPVVLCRTYNTNDLELLQVQAGADFGALLLDGFGDGLWLENDGDALPNQLLSISYGILQATRVRVSKTEYISCPSCGRTLFDLQTTIAHIKEKTSHLKGLKIGIMGCIVNGPGEMADADYGYVGAAAGKVNLYKKQICVEKNIPAENAVDRLIDLIKSNGDWVEKV